MGYIDGKCYHIWHTWILWVILEGLFLLTNSWLVIMLIIMVIIFRYILPILHHQHWIYQNRLVHDSSGIFTILHGFIVVDSSTYDYLSLFGAFMGLWQPEQERSGHCMPKRPEADQACHSLLVPIVTVTSMIQISVIFASHRCFLKTARFN